MASFKLRIDRGVTLTLPLVLKDADGNAYNLTGCSAQLHILKGVGGEHLSSSTGVIASGGRITFTVAASVTDALALEQGAFYVDLTLSDTTSRRILRGPCVVIPKGGE